jgi:cohesin domain-containing protein
MKSKRLFQIFILLTLLFSPFGNVSASTGSVDQLDAMVINRSLNLWDATYFGFVSSSIFENWQFEFAESHNFVVTVTPISGDLLPQLSLLDTGGNTLANGTDTLTSTQPAGSYSIQVQPASGGGFYMLTIREIVVTQPSVTTSVSPSSINAGESATVTVSLNNVPAEGYTSAEFTCTYDASLVQVSNIAVTNLFGADAAVAINSSQNGSFIVAVAGSKGNKATTSGSAFTFTATGLNAGQSAIECTVRVSKGDNALTSLSSTGTNLTVVGSLPTATFTPTPFDTPTPTSSTPVDTATPTSSTPVDTATPTSSTPVDTATPTSSTPVDTATPTSSTPVDTATPTSSTPVDTATPTSSTPVDTATPTSSTPVDTATPVESPTPTTVPDGSLTGQVLAGKPITVGLYSGTTLVTSVTANNDGTFSLTAPAGSYTVLATSSGFLSAQGSATITGGSSNTKPTITLLAGDIDGNNVIDQFDALTIGMNYNAATPSAADLNNDGVINVLDLELLADNYRATGPLAWEVSYP